MAHSPFNLGPFPPGILGNLFYPRGSLRRPSNLVQCDKRIADNQDSFLLETLCTLSIEQRQECHWRKDRGGWANQAGYIRIWGHPLSEGPHSHTIGITSEEKQDSQRSTPPLGSKLWMLSK